MKKQLSTSKHGFTIIEVVLVLAIAGLIFLMVFVALPALQRSQRDTQRRDDMSRLASALTQYQANNDNNLPSDNTFVNNYLAEGFKDPSGNNYTVTVSSLTGTNTSTDSSVGTVTIYKTAYCEGETAKATTGNSYFAIVTKLEGSGYACVDNK